MAARLSLLQQQPRIPHMLKNSQQTVKQEFVPRKYGKDKPNQGAHVNSLNKNQSRERCPNVCTVDPRLSNPQLLKILGWRGHRTVTMEKNSEVPRHSPCVVVVHGRQ